MSFTQREMYSKYNDVTIVDITYNTNRFQMMLCIITVIDNNYRTRIVTYAIIENEILNTYKWIFKNILVETGSFPRIIFINLDSFMIRLIKDVYPNA